MSKNRKFVNGLPVKEEVAESKKKSENAKKEQVENAVKEEEMTAEVATQNASEKAGAEVAETAEVAESTSEKAESNSKKENKEQKAKGESKKDSKDGKNAKNAKNAKNKKKANANGEEKRTLAQKTRATVSELKKVTWPSFGQTVKQTGVVIAFVLIFVVILLGLNSLFGWLFNLIIDALV